MGTDSDGNALTEVALALSMAFFSLMVLAMVFMGLPAAPAANSPATVRVADATPVTEEHIAPSTSLYLFFHAGSYYDQDLRQVDPKALVPTGGQQWVIAVAGSLPMEQVLQIQAANNRLNPVITTLNDEWTVALEAL
ncbi:MAG: hypothetical protein AAF529_00640 [Pseudomonadota bacterium]